MISKHQKPVELEWASMTCYFRNNKLPSKWSFLTTSLLEFQIIKTVGKGSGQILRAEMLNGSLETDVKKRFRSIQSLYSFLRERAKQRIQFDSQKAQIVIKQAIAGKRPHYFYIPLLMSRRTLQEDNKDHIQNIFRYYLKSKSGLDRLAKPQAHSAETQQLLAQLSQSRKTYSSATDKEIYMRNSHIQLLEYIDILEERQQQMRRQFQWYERIKEAIKHRKLVKVKINQSTLARQLSARLGQRVHFSVEQTQQSAKFTILQNKQQSYIIIARASADINSYKVQCRTSFPKKGKFFTQIELLKLINSNLLVGVIEKDQQRSSNSNRRAAFLDLSANAIRYSHLSPTFPCKNMVGEGQSLFVSVDIGLSSLQFWTSRQKIGVVNIKSMKNQNFCFFISVKYLQTQIKIKNK